MEQGRGLSGVRGSFWASYWEGIRLLRWVRAWGEKAEVVRQGEVAVELFQGRDLGELDVPWRDGREPGVIADCWGYWLCPNHRRYRCWRWILRWPTEYTEDTERMTEGG